MTVHPRQSTYVEDLDNDYVQPRLDGYRGPVRILDPCCGCGGNVLGMKMAFPDSEIIGIDIAVDALKTLHYNLKNRNCHAIRGDMRHLPLRDDLRFEIISGGPPCQGFSVAGFHGEKTKAGRKRHKMLRDLTRVFGDIIVQYRPLTFVMENVPGILGHDEYWTGLRRVLEDAGFFVTICNLNACDYGVPQYRQRVIFLGSIFSPPDPPPVTHFGHCPKCHLMCQHSYYTAEPGLVEGMYFCKNGHVFLRANLLE